MRNPSSGVALQAKHLRRVYDGAVSTIALDEASFTVREGEFVAIVGPSGSGKSTLLNLLGLLDSPTGGNLEVMGRRTEDLTEKQRNKLRSETIGFIFQNSFVLSHEPAALNAALGLRIQGAPTRQRSVAVTRVLTQFRLADRANVRAGLLSGGERQRLAIARAMAPGPRVLLADEPTGNLDSMNTMLVIEDLRMMAQSGVAVVVITHDEQVAAAADRRLSLTDGVLTETCSGPVPTSLPHFKAMKPEPSLARTAPGSSLLRVLDSVADSLNELSTRPLRTALLLAAFLLGAGGLTAANGLTQTTSVQVAERLDVAALDEVRFTDDRLTPGTMPTLTEQSSIVDSVGALEGVELVGLTSMVAPSDGAISRPPSSETYFSGPIEVADVNFLTILDLDMAPRSAQDNMRVYPEVPFAVIGRNAATTIGIQNAAPGIVIWVQGAPVPVIAIIENSSRDASALDKIFLNPAAAFSIRNLQPTYVVRTKPGSPAPLSDAIPRALSPGSPGAIDVQTVADLRSLKTGIGEELGLMVGLISIVLLVLASLTAATAMYLSVQARSGEVALRRALGASRWAIARMFLFEGILIGTAGGLSGSVLGTAAVIALSAVNGWTPVMTPVMAAIGVAAGMVTGATSAVYPAAAAARADPAVGLRT